jgi:hypothetical protein
MPLAEGHEAQEEKLKVFEERKIRKREKMILKFPITRLESGQHNF